MDNSNKKRVTTQIKYQSKKRGKFTIDFIEELRENVKLTCNVLRPERYYDFYSSKQSVAYAGLDDLLKQYDFPDLDMGTLNNFFTKAPIDDNNTFNEYYSFEERTINILQDFVEKNQSKLPLNKDDQNNNNEILNQDLSKPELLNIDQDINSAVKSLLEKLYANQKAICDGYSELTINENGTVTFFFKVFLNALTAIYNLRVNVYSDHQIIIKKITACEVTTNKNLVIYPCELNNYSFFGFILLPEPLAIGTNYAYSYQIELENYFKDFFENGVCDEQRVIVNNKYESIKDVFRFPDIEKFKNVSIAITKHPNNDLLGKKVDYTIVDNYKVFQIQSENLYHTQSRIEYKIQI